MLDEQPLDVSDQRVETPEPHVGLPMHQLDQEVAPEEKDRPTHLVSIGQDLLQSFQHRAFPSVAEETAPAAHAVEEFRVDLPLIVLNDSACRFAGTDQQALPFIKYFESFHLFLHA